MSTAIEKLKNEPAAVVGVVSALLTLAVAFGVKLSVDQTASVVAVVQVIAGLFVRSKVTPTRKVRDAVEQ